MTDQLPEVTLTPEQEARASQVHRQLFKHSPYVVSTAARLIVLLQDQLAKPAHEREGPHCSTCACGMPAQPPVAGPWIPVSERAPEPEVLVLCWDGARTFVEWFGSKPDAGRGVTHWIPYEKPPGAVSPMHDGRRALTTEGGQ